MDSSWKYFWIAVILLIIGFLIFELFSYYYGDIQSLQKEFNTLQIILIVISISLVIFGMFLLIWSFYE